MALKNPTMASHAFLAEMYADPYFPDRVVAKGEVILRELCGSLEAWPPKTDDDVLRRTHAATERFNELEEEFSDAGSELETGARECIAGDFGVIVDAYGFGHLDIESVIAPREW